MAATTPVGADGTSPARSTPLEPACVRGVVSCGEVGNGASRCNTVLWCHKSNPVEEIKGRVRNKKTWATRMDREGEKKQENKNSIQANDRR